MDALLAQPRGFCAGVVRAVEIVEQALRLHGPPVFVFHEIVHNSHVVDALRGRGAVFVDDLEGLEPGAAVVFSAHGVSNAVRERARRLQLRVIDATCPLVQKVHTEARRFTRAGAQVVLVGLPGHDEVTGTLGATDRALHLVSSIADVERLAIDPQDDVAYVTQTTLSVDDTRSIVDALRARFPRLHGPSTDDICYATQNRQNALRDLAARCDLILVVGARNSSNTNRLHELAQQLGRASHLIESAAELDPRWFVGVACVGITAGASTPEFLVEGVCNALRALDCAAVDELPGLPEEVVFRLPADLLHGDAMRTGVGEQPVGSWLERTRAAAR
jgi:4-hydroxy-3-methylbut-2-enyl diphosphate reductase